MTVTSYGLNDVCRYIDGLQRVDIAGVQDWLAPTSPRKRPASRLTNAPSSVNAIGGGAFVSVRPRPRPLDVDDCSSYARTMLWQVDPASPQPLYEQLASSVRRAVADETVTIGERLPSARDVAASLDVNPHTVLRAYQLLRDEGLIELRRGRGAIVTASHPGRGRVAALVSELVAEASRVGLGRDDLARLIRKGA